MNFNIPRLRKALPLLCAGLLIAATTACKKNSFTVEGTVKGADNTSLLLEKSDYHGRWQVIDSTRTDKSGRFSISQEAPNAPEIYRLCLDDRYIYFPIDSTESINVSTTAKGFGLTYELSGSEQAQNMARFDQMAAKANKSNPDSLEALKKAVFEQYIRDSRGSLLSYYVLTKTFGNKPIFDVTNPGDIKYFAAVATAFEDFRPDDPRTAMLKGAALTAMRRRNSAEGRSRVMEGRELKLIEIALPDETGKEKRLSDVAREGKPTVLAFSLLTLPDSPEIHRELAKIRENRGVNIYQVGLDPDQYSWREAARNLPWTTVYDAKGAHSPSAIAYNAIEIPVYFIYNSRGELVDRAETIAELKSKLANI